MPYLMLSFNYNISLRKHEEKYEKSIMNIISVHLYIYVRVCVCMYAYKLQNTSHVIDVNLMILHQEVGLIFHF